MPRPLLSFLPLLLLLAGLSFADSLSVEKLLEKTDLSAGDNVQVLLKFSNPFGRQVPLKIVDKNILGGNGLDVQCLEYALPADRTITIGYEPIPSVQSGSFTLGKAQITYTNPQTGKEETVFSNPFDVTVKPSNVQPAQQSITTLYQCGGMNMKSTSSTSSGQQPPQQQPQSQAQQQAQQTQDKLQGMQQQNMQDMNSVKQQMEQQQKQENALKNQIEQDPGFKKLQDGLQKQGYALQKSQINPEQSRQNQNSHQSSQQKSQTQNLQSQNQNPPQNSQSPSQNNPSLQSSQSQNPQQNQNSNSQQNSQSPQQTPQAQSQPNSQSPNPQDPASQPSASFQYDFQKPTGENATIQGKLENGNLTELSKWSAEDEKALSDKITQDPRFRQLSQSLQKQGFNNTGQKISPPSANLSQFTYSFSNLNETRNITGTATQQGNVTSIKLEQPEKKSNLLFWLFLLLLLLLAYLLRPKKPVPEPALVKEVRINYRKEALSMIAEAERLFSENKQKEAFSLLSEAVRFYFKHRFVPEKKELSTSGLLACLKEHDRSRVKPAQDCIGLCDLVVFAKFSPDAKDFSRAASLAKKLVSK